MDEPKGVQGMTKVMRFRVFRHAWECDPWGWVAIRHDGTHAILLTDHGTEFEATPDHLHALIREYQKVITETTAAMSMVGWSIEMENRRE